MPSQGDVGEEIWAPLVTFFRCRRCVRCAGRAVAAGQHSFCINCVISLLLTCFQLAVHLPTSAPHHCTLFEAGEQTLAELNERAHALTLAEIHR